MVELYFFGKMAPVSDVYCSPPHKNIPMLSPTIHTPVIFL